MNSKNPITKKTAKNESKALSEYLRAVKAANKSRRGYQEVQSAKTKRVQDITKGAIWWSGH